MNLLSICNSYVFLCNQLPRNLAYLKTNILSQSFCQDSLAQGLLWDCSQVVGQDYGLWRLDWGWRIHFQDHSPGCWQEPSVHCHVVPLNMTSHDLNGFPQSKCWERVRITARVRDGKNESTWCRERNTAFFYNLISSDMSYTIGHTEQFYTVWTVWKGTTQGVNSRRWGSLESPWRLTKILFYRENRAIRKELPQAPTAILANYQYIFYFTATVIMNSLLLSKANSSNYSLDPIHYIVFPLAHLRTDTKIPPSLSCIVSFLLFTGC